ncbi:hypothetical protein PanWU01x14_369040 [Parasponia andersonii]|uniref:NAC domain containing protein n=1 Tax=Parasponia andersonii TaxID=3476 RepID=A0A2P5A4T1_PARAD|nr:hypothetical protein PanWU01x14_369040 [Parasponia andersonii]
MAQLDDWALCKLYKKGHPEKTKGREMETEDEEAQVVLPSEEQDTPSLHEEAPQPINAYVSYSTRQQPIQASPTHSISLSTGSFDVYTSYSSDNDSYIDYNFSLSDIVIDDDLNYIDSIFNSELANKH